MTDKFEQNSGGDLLDTILSVVHGQRSQNIHELVSLLALSNLLGIISFLNQPDLRWNAKTAAPNLSNSTELKDMVTSLLGNMGGGGQDKKMNPALLMNLLKALSSGESAASPPKTKTDKRKEEE